MANSFPRDTSKYQLIVSDFDGTLAGPEHIVTPKVVDAVKRWIASGRHFTIATGRQFLMIEDECKKLGLVDPVVVRAGAEVIDPVSGSLLNSELIESKDAKIIKENLDESGLFQYGIEVSNIIYGNLDFNAALDFPKIKYKTILDFKLQNVAKFHAKPKSQESEADEIIKDLSLKLPNIHFIATHSKIFGKGWDITSVRATKLFGIVKVMEHLDIEREEIVGVGDSYNDFPLLEAAGFKVAMGNAVEEIKVVADVTVSSNADDGVAELIDKLLQS